MSRLDYRNNRKNEHLEDIIGKRLSRRAALKGMATATSAAAIVASGEVLAENNFRRRFDSNEPSTLTFGEIQHKVDRHICAPDGYTATVVVRWGDPIVNDANVLDFAQFDPQQQLSQFGYNNDFVAFMPLPINSQSSDHGLLCVNHEYVSQEIAFPENIRNNSDSEITKKKIDFEMAAHGHSVVEIKRIDGKWKVIHGKYNRRISAAETKMKISGPVAGHERLKGLSNPTGFEVVGTVNNCAGGVTPWGTVLIAEENFHDYFGGKASSSSESDHYKDYGIGSYEPRNQWYLAYERYDLGKDPNGPNNFGWIVEFDPYDPTSVPVKRTALGRARHEGATTALSADGRLVLYSGDDSRGEYLYKFVSTGKCHPSNRWENRDLLDHGTLYVARFFDDGRLQWLPLVHGKGKLTEENGFQSLADVLLNLRRSADLLGATPMDRPEDAETNPLTGRVYVILTNNEDRTAEEVDAANPRVTNKHGHILELIPPLVDDKIDHAATEFKWEMFIKAGDPAEKETGAKYHSQVTEQGWLSCPDNCAFDNLGRIWIATDGAPTATQKSGEDYHVADAIYASDTTGPGRALTRQFFRGPVGAEICGPCFTPDNTTLFAAIQHPGEGNHADGKIESTYENPSTRWPDFKEGIPPRPAIVAITKDDGGIVGS